MIVEKTIIAIPARLNSSRLPDKILADIGGEPLLKLVIDRCKLVPEVAEVVLCTDSEKISKLGQACKINTLITPSTCSSGTDRIASVINKLVHIPWKTNYIHIRDLPENVLEKTLIINVQGDQPFIDPNIISEVVNQSITLGDKCDIITPIYLLKANEIHNHNKVKVVISSDNNALYFSRSTIPFISGKDPHEWFKYSNFYGHIGIYAYKASLLAKWSKISSSKLDKLESLEQLKFLESGYKIKTILVKSHNYSIDTHDDLKEINFRLSQNQLDLNSLEN